MPLRPVAITLLLGLAIGVVTAASPCALAVPHQVPPAAAKASCHHGMAHHHSAAANPARHRGCCDPTQSHPDICQKACQTLAVLGPPAAPPVLERRMQATSPPAERPLSLFVAAIDHIPLA